MATCISILEYQDTDGQWQRAQSHEYSTCGNSYFDPPTLPNEYFTLIQGYQPVSGKRMKIRYRLYGQKNFIKMEEVRKGNGIPFRAARRIVRDFNFTSNVGEGLIDLAEVHRAQNDDMALSEDTTAFVVSSPWENESLRTALLPGRSKARANGPSRFCLGGVLTMKRSQRCKKLLPATSSPMPGRRKER